MRKYDVPEIEVICLSTENVIRTSGNGNISIEGGEITGGAASGSVGGAGNED